MIFYIEQMNCGQGLLLRDANEQVIRCKCGISYFKNVSSSIKSSNSNLKLDSMKFETRFGHVVS